VFRCRRRRRHAPSSTWTPSRFSSIKKNKSTSSCTSTDQAGYGKRTACRYRRRRRHAPSSTPSTAGFSLTEKKETLRRFVHL
jgi:hypothetical protein